MREIKFRAWNESAKRHSKPFGISATVLNYTDDDGLGVMKSLTTETIEQYTGLKDKNGVDVYEGDVLKAWHHEHEMFEENAVTFENGTFSIGRYWKDGSHDWHSMEQYDSFELEIIGNIHQNKDKI